MEKIIKPIPKSLALLLLLYGLASLIHFIHNAEYVSEYPGLPASWTTTGVYLAWVGMTMIGFVGWLLLMKGYEIAGLFVICIYACLGLDSLGHYMVAPFDAHNAVMNTTILLEVIAAGLLLVAVGRVLILQVLKKRDRGLISNSHNV